jgi:hypothetical protein
MYLIGNELLIHTVIAEREREVREITPTPSWPRRATLRAILATCLAKLALSIDHDAAGRATGLRAVDFADSGSS